MATLSLEPEGGKNNSKEVITLIKAENNVGKHWPVVLKHGKQKETIPEKGLSLHINGGPVFINGIEVTKYIQKGVENIFRHNSWSGKLENITKK